MGFKEMKIWYLTFFFFALSQFAYFNQGRKCREISAIYCVSEPSDTTFRGDMSEGQFSQKIAKKSAIYRRLTINRLGRQLIADFLAIFCEKSNLSPT